MATHLSDSQKIISVSFELCLLLTVAYMSALCWLLIPLLYTGVGSYTGMRGQVVYSPSVLYWTHLRSFPLLTESMQHIALHRMARYTIGATIVFATILARWLTAPAFRATIYIFALWLNLAVILMFVMGILIIL